MSMGTLEPITISLIGGPLDGAQALADPAQGLEPGKTLRLVDPDTGQEMPMGDEYRLATQAGRLWGVHQTLLPSQHDPGDNVVEYREVDPPEPLPPPPSSELRPVVPLCEPGTHDWTPWERTRRGNRTRRCRKCHVGQGDIL